MMERLLHFFEQYPIDLLSHLSSCLPIIIGIKHFSNLEGNLKYIWVLFVFFFVKDTYALIHMFLIPNILYIQNLEAIIETIIVGTIFYFSFDKPTHKRIIAFLSLSSTVITILFFKSEDVSAVSLSIFRVFSIILSLSYFNKVLTDMRVHTITKHSMFWFSAGLLIFSAGTFFIVLFSEYWYKDINKVPAEVFDKYWNINQLLFIFFCILGSCGLWVSKYDQENII